MFWYIFLISMGLVSARNVNDAESELLDSEDLEEELFRSEENLASAKGNVRRNRGAYFNQVSSLGDILLTEEQARQGINLQKYTTYKWPNGRVPYTINRSHFTRSQRRTIRAAIADFNERLAGENKVELVPRSTENDYIEVINGEGCYSYLGRVGGQQTLSLQSSGCLDKATIQHEFMHAIGFTHEQNRFDRDHYVKVLYENIPQHWQSQYEKVDEGDFINIGDYEWYSIMHYPWWAPDTDGLDAFGILADGIDKNLLGEGEDGGATPMDIHKINTLYA